MNYFAIFTLTLLYQYVESTNVNVLNCNHLCYGFNKCLIDCNGNKICRNQCVTDILCWDCWSCINGDNVPKRRLLTGTTLEPLCVITPIPQPTPPPTTRPPTTRPPTTTKPPTNNPSARPTPQPTRKPTSKPTRKPTPQPTPLPTTASPTSLPTKGPITQTIIPYTWIDYDHILKTHLYFNDPAVRDQIAEFAQVPVLIDFPNQMKMTKTNDGIRDIGVFECTNDGRDIYTAAIIPPLQYDSFALEVVAKIKSLDTIFSGFLIGIDTNDNTHGNAIGFNEIISKTSLEKNKFFAVNNNIYDGWHATNKYWQSVAAKADIELEKFYHIIISQDSSGFVQVYVNGKKYGSKYSAVSGPKDRSGEFIFPFIWICGDLYGNVGIDASVAAWGFYKDSFDTEYDATISCLVAGSTDCNGIATIPTPAPTNAPTKSPIVQCQYGVNYWRQGHPAYVSGDPHFGTFNGDVHDFMGRNKQQYYYMHPCFTSTTDDMPFSLLGYHERIENSIVTGLDYITFQLHDGINGDLYYIWLSTSIHSFTLSNSHISSVYDTNIVNGHVLMDLTSGQEEIIGSRFKALFTQVTPNRIDFSLTVRDSCQVKLYMQSQGDVIGGRYRMHYLQVQPAECFKCHTCGLMGGFVHRNLPGKFLALRHCDGSAKYYQSGWNDTRTEAYDWTGWKWGKKYVDEYIQPLGQTCASRWETNRRRRNLISDDDNEFGFEDVVYIDPCDANIKQNVIDACQQARDINYQCCNLIGGVFCDQLQNNCQFDACVNAQGNVNVITEQVNDFFTKPLQLVCNLPDANTQFDLSKLIGAPNEPLLPLPSICNSQDALNIAFLLDESGSINEAEWNTLISFVKRVIEYDISPLSHVSLIEYANIEDFQQFVDFTNINGNKQFLVDALENNEYNTDGATYTFNAVNRVLDIFENYKLNCMDGCESRDDLIFVITDGSPTDNVCPHIIQRISQINIDFVIIGIGVSGNTINEISCLDIDDNGKDIIVIDDFEINNFIVTSLQIRSKTCKQ